MTPIIAQLVDKRASDDGAAQAVIRAANQLSYGLAGSRSAATPAAISRWHP